MAANLPRVKKGKPPGFAQADFANKILQSIDDLRNLTISPAGFGTLVVGDKGVVLDLTPIKNALDQLAAQVANLVQNGGTGGNGPTNTDVTDITNRLDNGHVECNEDGTVSLII